MANFKRRKCKRVVTCSMCTEHRWRGNHQGRFKEKEDSERRRTDPRNVAAGPRPKSPKKNWSRNKQIRSLRDRLKSLKVKKAEYELKRRKPSLWTSMIRDEYDKDIESCERQLVELEG